MRPPNDNAEWKCLEGFKLTLDTFRLQLAPSGITWVLFSLFGRGRFAWKLWYLADQLPPSTAPILLVVTVDLDHKWTCYPWIFILQNRNRVALLPYPGCQTTIMMICKPLHIC